MSGSAAVWEAEMKDLGASLKTHFGFDDFRPGQHHVVHGILEGRSVVAVMPTGSGKSLCYQLPAIELGGVTLVVSPLISLMKDQVDSLNALGIAAESINSTQDAASQQDVLARAERGEIRLLYVAPERFRFAGAT
jgi:ATP-dependent DNA helicase RecQ